MTPVTLDRARAAKAKIVVLLATLPELCGIGIAVLDDGFGVKVNVLRLPPPGVIPEEIDGAPVIIDVVGPIRAL